MPGPYAPSDDRNYVGVGKQAVRGTAVAPALFVPYLPSVDLDHGQSINLIKEAGAAGMVTTGEKAGHMPSGRLPFLCRPSLTGKILAYLLGKDTISGAGPYDHVLEFLMTLAGTIYASIEQNLVDEGIERFRDCLITEVVISVDRDNPILRGQAGWVGGKPAYQGAATAETYETDRPFLLSDCTFTVDGGTPGAADMVGFTQTIRVLASMEKIIDVIPEYGVKLGLEVETEISQLMTVMDAYRLVQYGAVGGSAHIKTPSTGSFIADFSYGAGASQRGLKLDVPNGFYTQAAYTPLSPDGSEGAKLTRTLVAKFTAGSYLFKATAKTNDSAQYLA